MLLARADEHSEFCASRPCALFLTEGYYLSPRDSQLLRISQQLGFFTVVAPWFALRLTEAGVFVTAGVVLKDDGRVPITDWIWLRPRLLLPLFQGDALTTPFIRRLSEKCRRAALCFHPLLVTANRPFAGPRVRVIPGLIQAEPRVVRVYMENGPQRRSAKALLHCWWAERAQTGLRHSNTYSRLLLFANLHVRTSTHPEDVCLLSVDVLPYGGFEPDQPFWRDRAFACLQFAYRRALDLPPMFLPTPNHYSPDWRISGSLRSGNERTVHIPESWLARHEGRMRLHCELGKVLHDDETRQVLLSNVSSGSYRGISMRARKTNDKVGVDFEFDQTASLADVPHPLAHLMPSLRTGHCYVDTSPRPDAEILFLDSRLIGPKLAGYASVNQMMLHYLGRCIQDRRPRTDTLGRRYVEPGVGRGYLVDFMRIEGRPEFYDFSVIGGGLTPYARGGYINVGRPIDGNIALGRALHRKQCAERLASLGGRVAPVVAIFGLRNKHVLLSEGERLPAALVVRGFRSVLRVRQLDPVACLYHSKKLRPAVVSFLKDARWNLCDRTGARNEPRRREDRGFFDGDNDFPHQLPRVGRLSRLLQPSDSALWVRRSRLRAARLYAPLLLEAVKARVAIEIGRDPFQEPLSNLEYAQWFASTMGRQLALFRRARFLHDYHQHGISYRHQLPAWLYTLGENNVTLMAEFPDLDTGVFVDLPGADSTEDLRLLRRDWAMLSSGFERFHRRDFQEARAVVYALVMLACYAEPRPMRLAMSCFESEYKKTLRCW